MELTKQGDPRLRTVQCLVATAALGASLLAPCAAAQAHFATVYEFSGGAAPAGLTAANGVLYGTAGSPDCGTVFELQPPGPGGGQWTQTVLYTFTGENGDACGPNGLTAGPNGILYGASIGGGFTHDGTVFELLPPTSPSASWTETVLHSFTGGAGGTPFGNVIIGGQGEIYGASSDGTYGCGNVFELRPPAAPGGEWTETVLYSFQGGEDGSTPYSPVTTAGDGSIYGTTFGTMIIGAGSGPGPYGVETTGIPGRDLDQDRTAAVRRWQRLRAELTADPATGTSTA
jgi:hypothetical protein